MNPIVLILLLGIGGVIAVNAANTSNAGSKSTIKVLNIVSLKIIGTEFEIAASIAIDNPTAVTLSIKKPYLKLFYNGNEIGNSIPNGDMIQVKGNARTVINNVNVRIPFTSIPTLAMAIFSSKLSDQTVGIEVATVVNGFDIKDRREFKISDLIKFLKK